VSSRPAVVILVVGDELVLGEVQDSNGSHMASALLAEGFDVVRMQAVRDVRREIVRAVREGVADAQVVMVSGGLGPTEDDRTREAVAEVAGTPLVESQPLRDVIDELYRRWCRKPLEGVYRQALLPEGARIFKNPVGSAQGFGVKVGSSWVIATAGVPSEFLATFDGDVLEFLRETFKDSLEKTEKVVLKVHGLPESEVNERLKEFIREDADPKVRLTVCDGIVSVRISATGCHAARRAAQLRAEVERRLGENVFGGGDDTLASAVVRLVLQKGLTVAVAESCTGGLIGHMLTDVPGVSAGLLLDAVTYSNEAKLDVLGVDAGAIEREGAVSEAVALEMARGARLRAGATVAVAVTGIAGPSGGTPEKPVGLVWIAVSGPAGDEARSFLFRPPRESIKRRSALHALDMLRMYVNKRL